MKTFKQRLFVNASQERELSICLETHRRLYNECLDGRQLCWDGAGVSLSYGEQSAWFKVKRKSNEFYAKLNFSSAQQTLRKLDKAYRSFFSRGGFPRFKGRDRFNSFVYVYRDGCKLVDGKLRLQNIGTIRVRWHRELPDGKIKQVTVVRENGKWYACFCVDCDPARACGTGSVGLDVGLNAFVSTSDGEFLGDSKIMKRNQEELRRRQRALSRCQRGSSRRAKVKKRVASLHAKVRSTRRDTHHKVACSLVDRYRVIAVENLNIKGMLKNRRLARSISDAGWGQFIGILTSKAEEAGGQVIPVDPRRTSQQCSNCGEIVRKSLSVRVHRCDCGCELDRDVNAAKNILARAVPEIVKPSVSLA